MKSSLKKQKLYLSDSIIKKLSATKGSALSKIKIQNLIVRDYKSLEEIYYLNMSIDSGEDIQKEFSNVLNALKNKGQKILSIWVKI